MPYNLAAIRKLIENALTEDEFDNLLFDDFSSIKDETSGQPLPARRRKLIEYANKQRKIPDLLKAIQELNPAVYEEFESELEIPDKPKTNVITNKPTNIEPTSVTKPTDVSNCDVLVLAANPIGTDLLQLEKESERIQQRLREGEVGKSFVVKFVRAVREDLSKYLLQYKPLIVHFCGHGNSSGDIILNNAQGHAEAVSPESLAQMLAIVGGRVECVVLNACFSLEKADALIEQVNFVVGMDAEIDDKSAISFAAGFYRGLGCGMGYSEAFEEGRNEINLSNLPDGTVPHCITRDTVLLQVDEVKPRVTRTFSTQQTNATLYPLWFGTNRNPIASQDISKGFSSERDRQIHYGTCEVTVPKSHRIGSTGSPWWKFVVTDDRLKLEPKSLKLLDQTSFFASIQKSLQSQELDENSALVFIHGFNVSFVDAARQAAQIGVDLQVRGIMAFYSWPSMGKYSGYTADEASIEASEQYITEFLINLVQKSGAKKIHIIAHSMGNRGLLRAMQRILSKVQSDSSDISFGQIFLAAPDVDPDLFQGLAEAYKQLAERTTLYVSSKDKALVASRIIHNQSRVGFSPPITVVEGIDTIDVSDIDLTLVGHGYFAEQRDLLKDIHNLLMENTPPDKRFALIPQQLAEKKYWKFKA
jgi:esterase/lipase superfamily enzyme